MSIVTLLLKKIFALRGEHVPGESERVRGGGGGGDGKKGREREPVIISFTTLFLPLLARLTEIIRFWQEPIN